MINQKHKYGVVSFMQIKILLMIKSCNMQNATIKLNLDYNNDASIEFGEHFTCFTLFLSLAFRRDTGGLDPQLLPVLLFGPAGGVSIKRDSSEDSVIGDSGRFEGKTGVMFSDLQEVV